MNVIESNDAYKDDFSNGLVTLASLCTFFGIISVLTGFAFVICSYMTLSLLTPISNENIFVFARGHMRLLHCPSVFLLVNFYTSLAYIVFFLMNSTGGTWRSVVLVLAVLFICLFSAYPHYVYAYNVSIKSGALSRKPIISKKRAMELTPMETQMILYRRAVRNMDMSLDTLKYYMTLDSSLDDNESGDEGGKGAGANEEYVGGDILKGGKRAAIIGGIQ